MRGQSGSCPQCGADLSFTHLLWECKFWDGKVKALPAEWFHRILHSIEPELWKRGMAQNLFRERRGGMSAFKGTGLWHDLKATHLKQGQACCLDIATTCSKNDASMSLQSPSLTSTPASVLPPRQEKPPSAGIFWTRRMLGSL